LSGYARSRSIRALCTHGSHPHAAGVADHRGRQTPHMAGASATAPRANCRSDAPSPGGSVRGSGRRTQRARRSRDAIAAELARRLGLRNGPSWLAERDGPAELANWLSLVSGSLGRIGEDVALMVQNEVGQAQLSGGGASSAMAHKSNPVQAEILVTLARFNASLLAGQHHALVHENERSGAAWTLE
jgi:adenylosuccinate lyase